MTVSGEFEVIDQARAPEEPFEPKPLQSAALGLGVGLLAGIGLAFLFSQLTTRVRGKHEIAALLDLPIIGTVPEIERRDVQAGGLITVTHPDGRAAESLRLLRSNLDYINVDGASSLLVTSGLAGEGKSMTACNLAVTMAMSGRSVAIADGDLRRPRVHEYFGLENEVGLSDVALGGVKLADALVHFHIPFTPRPGATATRTGDQTGRSAAKVTVSGTLNGAGRSDDKGAQGDRQVAVLTAGQLVSHPGELVASKHFGDIIRKLRDDEGMEFVIVDAPPLLEVGDAAAMAAQVDALVVVVDVKKARQESLLETQHLLTPLPSKKLGVILLRTKPESRYGYYY
jgi:Mrp family chromosome partitioning ATPase